MAKTTEQMLAEAKAAGVEATVTQRPKGGEIAPLPGLEVEGTPPGLAKREEELLEDSDGSGVDE
jgi:hypothetical protein